MVTRYGVGSPSKLASEPTMPDDGRVGDYTRERLLAMDAAFCAAMARAIARGLERRPHGEPRPVRAA
jgi:hypothetical protein